MILLFIFMQLSNGAKSTPEARNTRAGHGFKHLVPVVGSMVKGREYGGLCGHTPPFRHP